MTVYQWLIESGVIPGPSVTEVLVKCLVCREQKPCHVSPIPPFWRCEQCAMQHGESILPDRDSIRIGLCVVGGGHLDVVYPTQWGDHCRMHLRIMRRVATYPEPWTADG